MSNKGKRRWLAAIVSISMTAAVGCEAVDGIDLNAALVSSFAEESMEGELTLAWELTPDPTSVPDDAAKGMLSAFGSGELVLAEMKQQDRNTSSYAGELRLSKGAIPFVLYMADNRIVADVEGAVRPYLIDLNGLGGGEPLLGLAGIQLGLGDLLNPAGETGKQIIEAAAAFLIGHVPNPADISVTQENETVGGESRSVTRIAMEAGADELSELLLRFATEAAQDAEGLKALIGTLFDVLRPTLQASLEENPNTFLQLALRNKPLAVDFIYAQLSPVVSELAAGWEQSAEEGRLLGPDSRLTAGWLLDGTTPVGFDLNLVFDPAAGNMPGIAAVNVDIASRWWNVGGDVTADTYDGEPARFSMETKPRDRLNNVGKGSLLYDILRNDLHLTRHSFDMQVGGVAGAPPGGLSPYIKGAGTTMVPVRYVSEQLDAQVNWNGATATVTITDPADQTTIVMKIGNGTATVNGVEHTLPEKPEIINSSTFVPIAFITRALGGTASWNAESGIVTIAKEF